MPSIVVVGAHWGDEGKGKIVDLLAQDADMVVRFSGGDNAGHTVVNDRGTFSLHNVPAGIFSPRAKCLIGNGVALNPDSLLAELEQLSAANIDTSRIAISDKAHLVLPYHLMIDGAEELARGKEAIGTTKRGIGPTYSDKAARMGIRVGDLLDPQAFQARLKATLDSKNAILHQLGSEPLNLKAVMANCNIFREHFGSNICQTELLVNQALDAGKTVIFEGAQGTLLDVQFGTYPFVTSSDTTAAGVFAGAGVSPRSMDCVLGVFKAYTTRVGAGPMPTELLDQTGLLIRERAHEFGTTTGRPRRCGWFDAVAGRYSVKVNGMTAGALTRLDVLDDFDEIQICTGYLLDGEVLDVFPSSPGLLERCHPIYEVLQGWKAPTAHLRQFEKLPNGAQAYIRRMEDLLECPMRLISVGPHRDESIYQQPLF